MDSHDQDQVGEANVVALREGGEVLQGPLAVDLVPPRREDQLPALVYLARLAPGSRPTMRSALNKIARMLVGESADLVSCPWHKLQYAHTRALQAKLAEQYAPATANRFIAAVKGVLQEAWHLRLMEGEEYHRAVDLGRVRGSTLPAGRLVLPGEIRALFAACDDGTNGGARDAAILALLGGALLRRAEGSALNHPGDYNLETGEVLVREGKGRKARITYVPPGGREAVADWLRVRGDEPGPLLCPVRKDGLVTITRLSPHAIRVALQRRQRRAPGVKDLTPHDLRRTGISELLDAGAGLERAQALAGHSSPLTTTRYDRRGERAKRQAADMRTMPYTPRVQEEDGGTE